MSSTPVQAHAARLAKWQWIQQGLDAPGAADKIRLYDAVPAQDGGRAKRRLHRWSASLFSHGRHRTWRRTLIRLASLAMEKLWQNGRLPHVEDWLERVRARPTFHPAFVEWLPAELAAEMRSNGDASHSRPRFDVRYAAASATKGRFR